MLIQTSHLKVLLNPLIFPIILNGQSNFCVRLKFLKGWFYVDIKDADQALKHFELSLSLREELGAKSEIALSLEGIAWIFLYLKGNFDRALKYCKRGLTVAEESGNKWCIGYCLKLLALVHSYKGELDRSIMLYEQSLTIFNDLNNKNMITSILNSLGNTYKMRGKFDRAFECIEQAMAINRDAGRIRALAFDLVNLIEILIDKGDLERAQQHLHDYEQLNNRLKNKKINLWYLYDKALLLKKSPRTRNWAKAEKIFRQLLEEEDSSYELIIKALLSLCELLLIELHITNDLEVLDELNQFIARLLEIAEKSHSYWFLCETLLIQAKLSLITFDIKKAQRFLTQAQQIAERLGLNQLAVKIANENDDLLTKLDLWEKLKDSGAPMTERLELARLDEKIIGITYKPTELPTLLTEEKISIFKDKKICLVCKGEVLRFSYICECGSIYCENCARALTNLENMCWACDVPIDHSKPVKPFKEEEERIKVKEKGKNK